MFPKSPVKGYFSCDKVRPENCKKGGYLTFHPEISFKKGWFFFLSLSISLWTPEKEKKGGGGYEIKHRGYIEQCSGFSGSLRQEKPAKSPRKGGSEILSGDMGGAFKGRERAYAYPK